MLGCFTSSFCAAVRTKPPSTHTGFIQTTTCIDVSSATSNCLVPISLTCHLISPPLNQCPPTSIRDSQSIHKQILAPTHTVNFSTLSPLRSPYYWQGTRLHVKMASSAANLNSGVCNPLLIKPTRQQPSAFVSI